MKLNKDKAYENKQEKLRDKIKEYIKYLAIGFFIATTILNIYLEMEITSGLLIFNYETPCFVAYILLTYIPIEDMKKLDRP